MSARLCVERSLRCCCIILLPLGSNSCADSGGSYSVASGGAAGAFSYQSGGSSGATEDSSGGTGPWGGDGGTQTGGGRTGDPTGGGPAAGTAPTEIGEVNVLLEGLEFPRRLALDDEGYLYVSIAGSLDAKDGRIVRVRGDGSEVETVATERASPAELVVDATYVYWTENDAEGGVYRVPREGGAAEPVRTNLEFPQALAVDGMYLYWSEGLTSSSVAWMTKADGTLVGEALAMFGSASDLIPMPAIASVVVLDRGVGSETTLASVIPLEDGIPGTSLSCGTGCEDGVLLGEDTLVYSVPRAGTVMSASASGGPGRTVAADQREPWGVAADASFVYFSERAGTAEGESNAGCVLAQGTIKAAPIDDSGVAGLVTLADALSCPSRLVVDGSAVYWVNNGVPGSANGSVMRVAKPR